MQVYKAMLKGVNPVAVKVLRDQSYTSRDEFGKEVGLLKTLHNSNIVQFQVRCFWERQAAVPQTCPAHRRVAWASSHNGCLRPACASRPAHAASHDI